MKSFDEIEKSVREKAKYRIQERDHRKEIINRSIAMVLGSAAVIGIGIFANVLTPPPKPVAENTDIISEATSDSTEKAIADTLTQATATTHQSAQTSQLLPNTTEIILASSQSNKTTIYTSVKTVKTTASAIIPDVATVTHTVPITNPKNERTIASTVTTSLKIKTTAKVISTTKSTSTTNHIQTTTKQTQTTHIQTAQTQTQTTYVSTVTTKYTPSYGEKTYSRLIENLKTIEIGGQEYKEISNETRLWGNVLTDTITEFTIKPTIYSDQLPSEVEIQVCVLKNIDPEYAVGVKFVGYGNAVYINPIYTVEDVINNFNQNTKEESS